MKSRKIFWIIIATVVVIGGGFYFLNGFGGDDVTFRTERVDRGDVLVSINATGTLTAVTTVLVGSQVSGTIAALYADFNSHVKQGQLLAQLDPTFLAASVSEQKANVARATAQMNEAERNFGRMSDLFEKQLISAAELDAARTSLESAKANYAQSVAALERAEVNLRYATIRAPISGVVISRDVDVGQTVAASLAAPTLFTIAQDLRKMQVETNVDEADIGNVKEGQPVTFRVDAFPDQQFTGVVSQVRLKPIVSQNVVTYAVIISVENPDQKLMPGMTANVVIEVAKAADVLRVPLLAMRFTPPQEILDKMEQERKRNPEDTVNQAASSPRQGGGGWEDGQRRRPGGEMGGRQGRGGRGFVQPDRVWVMENNKMRSVMIRKGLQDARYAEVLGGRLKEGDEVVVGMIGGTTAAAVTPQNPFMPQQMPRGSRRGF